MGSRILFCCGLAALIAGSTANSGEVRFRKIVLDKTFRAEGVATGNVNHDGKLDVLAGDVWFEAPDWKMHELRPVGAYNPEKGYSKCFAQFARDVNGDGWVDTIIVGMPGGPALWYENSQGKPGHWKERVLWKSACNETPVAADLLGDGKPVPIFGVQPEGQLTWFGIPKDLEKPWDAHPISTTNNVSAVRFAHGLGVGDMNKDGRNDVLFTNGWWEAPEDRAQSPWKFHPAKLGPHCANMIVYDVNGDGFADVITSSAHDYGMWWFEQKKTDKGVEFAQHEIFGKPKAEPYAADEFRPFSEAHALMMADINGDGLPDLVTGKRWYAHNGGDPGGKEPAVLYWFEQKRVGKDVQWMPRKIDDDSGVGTQFEVRDMNGDGKLDIVISNKKGVFIFMQE